VDTCGYFPRVVRDSAQLLAPSVARYAFISTESVYAEFEGGCPDEDARLATTDEPDAEKVTGENYGALKVLCEAEVLRAFGDRALLPRPGLIVGPWDRSDRYTYWVIRASEGGRMLAPGRPEAQVQVIDVRDLATWTLDAIEKGLSGPYNLSGPARPYTMREMLEDCVRVAGAGTMLEWVPDEWLVERELVPWGDLPLWYPETDLVCSNARVLAAGLSPRPIEAPLRDTLAWRTAPPLDETPLRAGIDRARMDALLAEWDAREG